MTAKEMRVDLSGKIAVVTGGGRGLGLSIAKGLTQAGAIVTIVGRNKDTLFEASDVIKQVGQAPLIINADVTKVSEINRIFTAVKDKFSHLDILVNNAGLNIPKPTLELSEEEWDQVMAVNLKATFFCCQQAARLMVQQGKGKIVNIASQLGLVGARERAPYCASKGGVIQLTRALALEWAEHKINVNAVAPTFMRTEMTEVVLADKAFYNSVIAKIPLGRVATPEDMVGGVLYLVSEAANMVTGHVLTIDGGWTVR